jgi:hypothetical protein
MRLNTDQIIQDAQIKCEADEECAQYLETDPTIMLDGIVEFYQHGYEDLNEDE